MAEPARRSQARSKRSRRARSTDPLRDSQTECQRRCRVRAWQREAACPWDKVWEIEFAPIARMDAWKVVAPKVGDKLAVVGYTFKDEKGAATLRVEFIVGNGRVTPLRSSPL